MFLYKLPIQTPLGKAPSFAAILSVTAVPGLILFRAWKESSEMLGQIRCSIAL